MSRPKFCDSISASLMIFTRPRVSELIRDNFQVLAVVDTPDSRGTRRFRAFPRCILATHGDEEKNELSALMRKRKVKSDAFRRC